MGVRVSRLLTIAACTALAAFAMPTDKMPPNTVMLSQMMRELSAQPSFTEVFLKNVQGGKGKHGAALLTPALIHRMRDLILGKNWQALDRFPGWSMGEINPTVRVVGHYAGKDAAIKASATAGGAPVQSAQQTSKAFLDLGEYGLERGGTVDLREPATGKGFDLKEYVSSLGDGVTRGDGPSSLATEHVESQRLAEILNRLSANGLDGVPTLNTIWNDERTPATPEDLIEAILHTGQSVTVTDSRYFANFGHLHYKGEDVMMPFFVNSQILVPHTRRSLLVPVAHAEYEWHIRGPRLNADVAFYFGIDGKAEFRTMDQLDQAWVMKREAHSYRQTDAIEVTRLAGAMVRTYMRLHAAHPAIPFGGYYGFGVCQDVVAAIELKMTGKATLFPNTADDRFFTGPDADPRDAEIDALIHRLPKDRAGKPPDVERVFASLPVGESDAELATVTIPGLGADLVAVHDAWTAGHLKRTRVGWRRFVLPFAIGLAVLAAVVAGMSLRSRHYGP